MYYAIPSRNQNKHSDVIVILPLEKLMKEKLDHFILLLDHEVGIRDISGNIP